MSEPTPPILITSTFVFWGAVWSVVVAAGWWLKTRRKHGNGTG